MLDFAECELRLQLERAIRQRDEAAEFECINAFMGWADACVEIQIIEEMLAAEE